MRCRLPALCLLSFTLGALAACTTGGGGGLSSGGPAAGTVGTVAAGAFHTVLLDPGHGGHDSGGTGNGLREKDLTLDTALRVRDELQRAGLRVVMTRTDDRFIELDYRVTLANRLGGRGGAVVVSIHYNATGGSSAHGAETFFWHPTAHGLATRIQRHLAPAAGLANVGVNRRRLRLTRNPDLPAVLVECAFVTNPAEAARLRDPATVGRIAAGIAAGIVEEQRLGDAEIPPVPYIASAPSRPTDPSSGGTREQVR